jgi:uncharacterized membrane protein YkvA (DUF1232 family)
MNWKSIYKSTSKSASKKSQNFSKTIEYAERQILKTNRQIVKQVNNGGSHLAREVIKVGNIELPTLSFVEINHEKYKRVSLEKFLKKSKSLATKVHFIRQSVAMYHCMMDSQTSGPVKAIIAAALSYFLLPADAMPDWLINIGFADDATVILTTLEIVRRHMTKEHWKKANKFLE